MKSWICCFFVLAVLVLVFSCKEDNSGNDFSVYNQWEITGFISVESVQYPKTEEYNPVLEILPDGRFTVELDVNHCCGNVELANDKKIKFLGAGCTKICCDSEFSQKFIEMLLQVESYETDGNSMKLEVPGWGAIILELHQ